MSPVPFDELPRTPAAHFKLYVFAAVSRVLAQAAETYGGRAGAVEQFPFLAAYEEQLSAHEPDETDETDGAGLDLWWQSSIAEWERGATERLPLRLLREACALPHDAMTLLLCAGLTEEDSRFGLLFEEVHGAAGQHRPTLGLVSAWWRAPEDCAGVRDHLRRLQALGLVQFMGTDAPRTEWALHVPALLWDVLRGETPDASAPWARYRAPEELLVLEELILPDELRAQLAQLPALLNSGAADALVVRGPRHNGRRTLVGAMARASGRALLEVRGLGQSDDARWQLLGPLSTMLHALPCVVLELGPGQFMEVPPLAGYDGPVGVVLGKQGGVSGEPIARALTFVLEPPDPSARRSHWERALGAEACDEMDEIGARFRLTGGHITRAAGLARAYAGLRGRERVTASDVHEATRALNREALNTLATPVSTTGDWSHLSVSAETREALRDLESRCRHRESLPGLVGAMLGRQLNRGVRALFNGASGTGKTLAARMLAGALQSDLYRLDLSAVVNKYIGETEKNLNQVFALAEELDVILLLDEGDALLTQRTDVSNSNDRYANLETNYLLQRLENYEGVLIVTTNASDRIDAAFQRRMDVVVTFATPTVAERWNIWQMHLPAAHDIAARLLDETAQRCELTGGQIRNAVLHATSLALSDGGRVNSAHFESAVRREYQKAGAVCPLPAWGRAPRVASSRW
ncbi:MAG TPA: ATP-binding protein [Pyrinomonadaceae bacterium]|nr:ATP-binding protein [Pyrinomonadaceae bacterium]